MNARDRIIEVLEKHYEKTKGCAIGNRTIKDIVMGYTDAILSIPPEDLVKCNVSEPFVVGDKLCDQKLEWKK